MASKFGSIPLRLDIPTFANAVVLWACAAYSNSASVGSRHIIGVTNRHFIHSLLSQCDIILFDLLGNTM
jgi:hypothetical protein